MQATFFYMYDSLFSARVWEARMDAVLLKEKHEWDELVYI
jgi:hypothetical protein